MQIKPLTPLWTGDAEGKGERVLETGILGSLRWWYEALVRGLGHYACDPGGGTCEYKEKLAGSCPVCQLFGCTGYSRRFRLLVEGGSGAGNLLEVKLSNPGNSNHCGWRIPVIVAEPLTLSFLPMRVSDLEMFERHRLMGTTSGKGGDLRPQKEVNRDRPKGSDIFVTHLYKLEGCWKMRIFAFIPKNGNQIDTACRTLLSSPSEMEKLLGQVVGDLSLKAEPYPADIESIFKGGC
ncbi:MAG: hypothetical protein DDT32_02088 [Syntrophomonadaceae bacterium]|nr:hypothetical protein [Bacillota bacterium]